MISYQLQYNFPTQRNCTWTVKICSVNLESYPQINSCTHIHGNNPPKSFPFLTARDTYNTCITFTFLSYFLHLILGVSKHFCHLVAVNIWREYTNRGLELVISKMKTNWSADLADRAAAVVLALKAEIFQKATLRNNLIIIL